MLDEREDTLKSLVDCLDESEKLLKYVRKLKKELSEGTSPFKYWVATQEQLRSAKKAFGDANWPSSTSSPTLSRVCNGASSWMSVTGCGRSRRQFRRGPAGLRKRVREESVAVSSQLQATRTSASAHPTTPVVQGLIDCIAFSISGCSRRNTQATWLCL